VKRPVSARSANKRERERAREEMYASSRLRATSREGKRESLSRKINYICASPRGHLGNIVASERAREARENARRHPRRRDYHRGLHVGPETAGASRLIFTSAYLHTSCFS